MGGIILIGFSEKLLRFFGSWMVQDLIFLTADVQAPSVASFFLIK